MLSAYQMTMSMKYERQVEMEIDLINKISENKTNSMILIPVS